MSVKGREGERHEWARINYVAGAVVKKLVSSWVWFIVTLLGDGSQILWIVVSCGYGHLQNSGQQQWVPLAKDCPPGWKRERKSRCFFQQISLMPLITLRQHVHIWGVFEKAIEAIPKVWEQVVGRFSKSIALGFSWEMGGRNEWVGEGHHKPVSFFR